MTFFSFVFIKTCIVFALYNWLLCGTSAALASAVQPLPPPSRAQTMQTLYTVLENYDGNVMPEGKNRTGPVIVVASMLLRHIDDIDIAKGAWQTQITFRMQWQDSRLAYEIPATSGVKYISVPPALRAKIWKPDLFFPNEKEMHIHKGMETNEYYRIYPDGEVQFSTRMTMTLLCPMVLHKYPHDTQTCSLRCASYGHTTEDLVFKWKVANPVQVTSDLYLSEYNIDTYKTEYCDAQTRTGVYSCLRFEIMFTRDLTKYMNDLFFPLAGSVTMGWLSFWFHPIKSATPRILLMGVGVLYAKINMPEITKDASTISYATAGENFILGCSGLLMFAFVEFVLVSYLANKYKRSKPHVIAPTHGRSGTVTETTETNPPAIQSNGTNGENGNRSTNRRPTSSRNHRRYSAGMAIDFWVRLGYPIVFGLFVMIYLINLPNGRGAYSTY